MAKTINTMIAATILLLSNACFFSAAFGEGIQSDSTEAQRATAQRLRERFGISNATINKYGVVTNFSYGQHGRLSLPMGAGDCLESIFQFLKQNSDIFQIENPWEELRVWRSCYPPNSECILYFFDFHQIHNDIVVKGAGMRIEFWPNLVLGDSILITKLESGIIPLAGSVDTMPSITKKQAIQIILADKANVSMPLTMGLGLREQDPDYPFPLPYSSEDFIITFREGVPRLEWRIPVFICTAHYVDAHTGEIVEREPTCIFDPGPRRKK